MGEVEGEREIDFAMGIIWITVLRVAASWKICLKSIGGGRREERVVVSCW